MGGFARNSFTFPNTESWSNNVIFPQAFTWRKGNSHVPGEWASLTNTRKKIIIPSPVPGCAPDPAHRTDLRPLPAGSQLIPTPGGQQLQENNAPPSEMRCELSQKLPQRRMVKGLGSCSYLVKFVHPGCQAHFSPSDLKRPLSSGTELYQTLTTPTISTKLRILLLKAVQTVQQLQCYFFILIISSLKSRRLWLQDRRAKYQTAGEQELHSESN